MSITLLAIFGLLGLFALIALGVPIAFAMIIVGAAGFAQTTGIEAALSILGQVPYHTVSLYEYVVIPLFILMGMFAFHSGISRDLFDASYKWLGAMPGGLAVSGICGCGMFSAICGSSMPTAAAMGLIALPEMEKRDYDMRLATGSIAAGGTLGVLIPPSLGLVVYGIITESSIGRLFIAGFLPGALMCLLFFATVWLQCRRNPALGPTGPSTTIEKKLRALKEVLPTLLIFLVCIGGIYVGYFTPVESAAVGALLTLIYGLVRGTLNGAAIVASVKETANISLMIFAIVIGANVFGYFITVTEIPLKVAEMIATTGANKYVVLLCIIMMYMLIGCVMEFFSMMILTLPIIFPTVMGFGFDPIWFGIILVIMLEIGQITPPIGINVFTIKGVAPQVPLTTIFRGVLPFWMAMLVCLGCLIAFPELALFLPSLLF